MLQSLEFLQLVAAPFLNACIHANCEGCSEISRNGGDVWSHPQQLGVDGALKSLLVKTHNTRQAT